MKRYCLALDLQDDPEIIDRYKSRHQQVPPVIEESIRKAGIQVMDIYLTGNRLFMIIEVDEDFSFERKARMDANNIHVQEWEEQMGSLQRSLPWAAPGEKWVLMERIFSLGD
ncbi:L-rhamnose mutarotase [Cyclobacterium jeungdonense]|uniref:L-rhamnose mutarotase n=1 Tax=Cyclobacterium jeungdonense TaxID=708087 RepID=A0ABT8CEV7_9BACT|nr:L-rhamnose mutarotase [Cyclobacterium jeungdonense]MDN3690318.1 L-rhamnose mutarotase [Cyclobacterium jeungdonense]